ncbi:MAG: hydrolase/aminopeptidase [Acidobacteria bacterium]|nr:MAG: hydrolase/aminopeptidase [Acidobacteriota bacterium]
MSCEDRRQDMGKFDPHSYTDLDQGKIKKLELNLFVDFKRKVLMGEATLHFHKGGEGAIDLDTRDLIIDAVYSKDGAPIGWEKSETEGFMGEKLRIFRPVGTKTLIIRYATTPQSSALQWLDPEQTAGGEHPYLFSQCQPIHARSMVPLQDSPLVRFTYTARIMVPKKLTAVMSAAPGIVEPGPTKDSATVVFDMPQPIPSYLLALAVGRMEHRDLSERARVYAEPATLESAAYEFADIEKMIAVAEQIFGAYPWERFDFAVMPPAFPYGGMENPRLTFLTPTLLAGDRSLANVLTHELAHSWTGNLVTNATMNDFWLNEGFTVWAERRILEKLEGEEMFKLAATLGAISLKEEIENFGEDSPYTALKTNLEGVDPDEVYSQVPYEKGFLFVRLLEEKIGREAFDEFVKKYINRFKFSSISTETFEAFFKHAYPELSDEIKMDEWIRGTGLPHNAPVFQSARLDELNQAAEAFAKDQDAAIPGDLNPTEMRVYLSALPLLLNKAQCQTLERTLGLDQTGNSEIRCQWYLIAIASGYHKVLPEVEVFLAQVGRMKFVKPLFLALKKHDDTASLASSLYEKLKAGYHPIAQGVLDKLMAK